MRTALLLFLLIASSFAFLGSKQSVAVQGRLICKGAAANGVKVKLYDKGVLIDSKLDEVKTNANGEFYAKGSKTEITSIDPKINVYHRCGHIGLCYRKFTIEIPKSYVSKGNTANKVYDIGTVNLQNKFSGEKTDCIN